MAIDQKWVSGAVMISEKGEEAIKASRTLRSLYNMIKNIEESLKPLLVAGNTEGVPPETISLIEESVYPNLYALKMEMTVGIPALIQIVQESTAPAVALIDSILPEGYTPPILEPEV